MPCVKKWDMMWQEWLMLPSHLILFFPRCKTNILQIRQASNQGFDFETVSSLMAEKPGQPRCNLALINSVLAPGDWVDQWLVWNTKLYVTNECLNFHKLSFHNGSLIPFSVFTAIRFTPCLNHTVTTSQLPPHFWVLSSSHFVPTADATTS